MLTGSQPVAITAGRFHTCCLVSSGKVICWGYNADGQLGIGNAVDVQTAPGLMSSDLNAVALGRGIDNSTGPAKPAAALWTLAPRFWGAVARLAIITYSETRKMHALGALVKFRNPLRLTVSDRRTTTLPGVVATAVAAGAFHTCALLQGGTVTCWGQNQAGQLGIGNTVSVGNAPDQMGGSMGVDLGPGDPCAAPCSAAQV
jgi:alpha-tubulin suppressor-like RCC1 family protein